MPSVSERDVLGRAVVEFSRHGKFLDDADLSLTIQGAQLTAAVLLVDDAKACQDSDIRSISKKVASQVDAWIKHAGALQVDIDQTKTHGAAILENAEKGEQLRKKAHDSYMHSQFLKREINYSDILLASMKRINLIKNDIDRAINMAAEKRTMNAVKLASESLRIIHAVPNYHRVRAYTLLENQIIALQNTLLSDFDELWQKLIKIDVEGRSIQILDYANDQTMNLQDAVAAMQYLGQVEKKIEVFKERLQTIIVQPRIGLQSGKALSRVTANDNILQLTADNSGGTVESLLDDLATTIIFVNTRLPDISQKLAKAILPDLCLQLRETRLNVAIPAKVTDMESFRAIVEKVRWFALEMKAIGWLWTEVLEEWVTDCARLWLMKRRENDLMSVRNHLALGVVSTKTVVREEVQTLQLDDSAMPTNGNNDWDEAWSDDDGDPSSKKSAGRQGKADTFAVEFSHTKDEVTGDSIAEDHDEADAWGWGDDDTGDLEQPGKFEKTRPSPSIASASKTKDVVLRWNYLVSTMPEGVLLAVITSIEDALALTQNEHANYPIVPAAGGLFGFPTPILAMYRAVSSYYYDLVDGGNMFLYNDALWLAEQLTEVSKQWGLRTDLPPRAHGKVKLDGEIASLNKFGRRAYAREITTQQTIIRDFLKGDQCFLSDEGIDIKDDEATVEIVIGHVKAVSAVWEPIVARTTWAQAVGRLLSTIADKVILDILDIQGLQADASYNIAELIAKITTLEELYTAKNEKDTSQLPLAAVEYASNWFKMQYLSEILQNNLDGVRYLWFEGEVSMFFTPEEVIDLINMSFAASTRREDIVRSIKNNRRPRPDLSR